MSETKTVKLIAWGYSDDTIIVEVKPNRCYDYNAFEKTPMEVVVSSGGESCRIVFTYTGVWGVGISQIDEEVPLPEWASHASFETNFSACRYTVAMILQVPEDVTVHLLGEEE